MRRKKSSDEKRLILLRVLRVLVLFVPYITVLIVKRASFFFLQNGTLGFTASGAICAALLLLLAFSSAKSTDVLYVCGVVFVAAWLLSPFLRDALWPSGTVFVCKVLDYWAISPIMAAIRERITIQRTADRTAAQVEDAVKKYVGRV